jgi:predicted ATPase/class 3 adenylate cyclase
VTPTASGSARLWAVERGRQTLTFLFTDIVDSTPRWEEPDVMRAALGSHDAVLREAVEGHGGEVFKHTGDGVAAVFRSAVEAVGAALEAQQRLELPVRMGLHSGEAEERDGDWFGQTLNRTARIMDAGHGGQVLCSAATSELLGTEIDTVVLGDYRLKGIGRPERIVQVGAGSHPPLRVAPAGSELPARRAELLGRVGLVAEVADLLAHQRLVTLVGPGGVGKTAVALEAAHLAAPGVDRAVFVDLAVVDQEGAILAAVVQALGVSSVAMTAVRLALAGSTTLLVFDNCEHLIDAAADTIDELLATVPGLRVVATSRGHLELEGERVVAVPPLGDDDVLVRLFSERVAANAGSAPEAFDRDQVVQLCRRLDGLPLAIELAAARASVLSVDQMLERMGDRFRLFGSGRRRGRDRHRTLHETIAWSHELLGDDERALYARLGVFTDWFDLEAAAAVAGTDEFAVLDGLEGLVGKSLVMVEDGERGRRYRYLESIRDHAWEQLDGRGETDTAMAAVIDHLARRSSAHAEELLWGDDTEGPYQALQATLSMRPRALAWCDASDDLERAVSLFVPLAHAPAVDARLVAGAGPFVERAVDRLHPDAALLVALHGLERMFAQDFRAYRPTLERVRTLLAGDLPLIAEVASVLAYAAMIAGDLATFDEMNEAAADLLGGDRGGARRAETRIMSRALRIVAHGQADHAGVADLVEGTEGLPSALARASGYSVAAMAALVGHPERAGELAHRALALEPEGSSLWLGAYHPVPLWHLRRGELDEALEHAAVTAATAIRLGERSALVPPLVAHALVLQRLDDAEGAATVRGALPRRWTIFATDQQPQLDAWLAERLTDDVRIRLAAKGAGMGIEELLGIAPAALASAARQ